MKSVPYLPPYKVNIRLVKSTKKSCTIFLSGMRSTHCLHDQMDVKCNKEKRWKCGLRYQSGSKTLRQYGVKRKQKPGPLDIARGKVKFSDMNLVMKLQELFGIKVF